MRNNSLLLLFLLLAVSSYAQKTDWNESKLKGKVKSLQSKGTHRYKKDGVFTPWENYYGYLTLFNNTGYKTEFSEFTGKDSLSYKIVYAYQPKEKTADLSYFDKAMKPTIKKKQVYDEKGLKIEELEYDKAGQPDRRYTYGYDERGNLVTVTGYKKDGTVSSKSTYTYDTKNKQTAYLLETPGYANSSRKFIYDDKGNMIEETWHNGKGAVDFKFVRKYDAQGNKILESSYKAGTTLLSVTQYQYEYDKKGNWTRKVDMDNDGTEFHTETRTITYY